MQSNTTQICDLCIRLYSAVLWSCHVLMLSKTSAGISTSCWVGALRQKHRLE